MDIGMRKERGQERCCSRDSPPRSVQCMQQRAGQKAHETQCHDAGPYGLALSCWLGWLDWAGIAGTSGTLAGFAHNAPGVGMT